MTHTSYTVRVLLGLAAGLVAGVAVRMSGLEPLYLLVDIVVPLGTVFINAIKMTIIPLVMSMLVLSVANAADVRAIGRMGLRAAVLCLISLAGASAFAAFAGYSWLAHLHIDPAASAALRGRAAATPLGTAPDFSQILIDMIPANVVRAAADGAMLPLMVFSLLFGLALAHLPDGRRQSVVQLCQGVLDALLVLVRWILVFMPVGVFALALAFTAQMGLAIAGALAWYLAAVAIFTVVFMVLVVYPAATLAARIPLRRFARAIAPAQAIGFTARSAAAALPTMVESSRTELRLSEEVAAFLIPLSLSTFRIGSAIGQTIAVLFIARLYDIPVHPGQFAAIIATVVLTTIGTPSVPAGSIIMLVPILAVAGLPAEGIGILLGVDAVADMFRTLANVTGIMAVPVIIARVPGVARERGSGRLPSTAHDTIRSE